MPRNFSKNYIATVKFSFLNRLRSAKQGKPTKPTVSSDMNPKMSNIPQTPASSTINPSINMQMLYRVGTDYAAANPQFAAKLVGGLVAVGVLVGVGGTLHLTGYNPDVLATMKILMEANNKVQAELAAMSWKHDLKTQELRVAIAEYNALKTEYMIELSKLRDEQAKKELSVSLENVRASGFNPKLSEDLTKLLKGCDAMPKQNNLPKS